MEDSFSILYRTTRQKITKEIGKLNKLQAPWAKWPFIEYHTQQKQDKQDTPSPLEYISWINYILGPKTRLSKFLKNTNYAKYILFDQKWN